jgi:hypothetical protein
MSARHGIFSRRFLTDSNCGAPLRQDVSRMYILNSLYVYEYISIIPLDTMVDHQPLRRPTQYVVPAAP